MKSRDETLYFIAMKRRLTHFLFFSVFLSYLAVGQNPLQKEVHIETGIYSVVSLLNLLSDQKINLAYSSDLMPSDRVTVTSKLTTVNQVLKKIKNQTGVQFRLSDDIILLSYQRKMYTLSGTIKDSQSGEALIGASILINSGTRGTVTNTYGFYSLTMPEGTYDLSFRFVGYRSSEQKLKLDQNIEYIVSLSENTEVLDEVVVSSIAPDYNVQNTIPGISRISLGEDWPIPYFLGEEDIFQNALLLPGIQSIGEDASGLNIRGGAIDQNLILLDGAPIYNPNHFYGLISVFSPEVINTVDIMKGYIPPQYGGRASSVINIVQKEGNNQEYHVSGGMGLVSGRLTAEGPIKKNESSFLFSARQSLLNFSIEDLVNESLDDSRTSFRDFNAKINWIVNNNNKIYLSGYYGQDRNRAGFDAIRKWGNKSMTLRWNHLFSPKIFSNFTAIVSEYTYQISDPQEVGSFIGKSNIVNFALKADFGWVINPAHTIDFGVHTILHKLKPGERIPFDENASTVETILDTEHAIESSVYLSHMAEFSEKLSVQYGIRLSSLLSIGPSEVYTYDPNLSKSDATITDTLNIFKRKIHHRHGGWEPRISLNYHFNENNSIKASYNKTYQYIHLISNTVAPAPTDIWKLSDSNIKPTISDHYSVGFYRNLRDNKLEASLEFFYKKIQNVIDFKDGADLLFNENIETELLNGRGQSYGMELFIKRNTGKIRGWLSYTLSRAEQKFQSRFSELTINNGSYFPSNFNKAHDITLVGVLSVSPRVSLSSSFNYKTGRPITLPVGKFIFDGKIVPNFENRNQNRLPSYHRLDLSLKLAGQSIKKNGQIRRNHDYWLFSLYNVYARKNIYSYFFRESELVPGTTEVLPYSIFGTIIPAVTYNFRF